MERNPDRERVIDEMRTYLRMADGDPHRGIAVFDKVCGQCHKIYGKGYDVGPDITVNGRGDFEQLLSNVFDPSLVIGADYQARTVLTIDGRVETGLLVEENDRRIVLRPQGSEEIVIAREDVEDVSISSLSLMPEDLEKQVTPEELADLFAFISLDKHPDEEEAKPIPGAEVIFPREEEDPSRFPELVDQILPGFTTERSGVDGVSVMENYSGRDQVLRTHPVSERIPCVLSGQLSVPADVDSRLAIPVGHDDNGGDWILEVHLNGERVVERTIGPETSDQGWVDVEIPLHDYAGETVEIELVNRANDWFYEFGYWGRARLEFAR